MKFDKIMILLSFILVVLLSIGSVSAYSDDNNLTTDSLSAISTIDESNSNDINVNSYKSGVGDVLTANTIVVEEVEKEHNEMNDPTIQKAIDSANPGDTIIIEGESYVHCHFIVNKKLTIISNVGTTMQPCGSNAVSGYRGIFYVTPEASGTVISGFTIINEVSRDDDYGIYVNGASDVTIKNCNFTNNGMVSDAIRVVNAKNTVIDNVSIASVGSGIRIINSENVKVENSFIDNAKYCINVIDSNKVDLLSNNITNNKIAGIAIAGTSKNVNIKSNYISKGNIGINMTSANYIYIISNYVGLNGRYGIYTNCNIEKMEVKGNFIDRNVQYNIFNDYRVRNIWVKGGENIQVINNNYMVGGDNAERPIWRQVYEYKGPGVGDYNYDPVNDVYTYVGENNGEYWGHQTGTFLGYTFIINQFIQCPNIYFTYPEHGVTPWTKTGNYYLYLTNITQIKKGVYQISIVDVNGNIAKEISSIPVTFYMMKKDLDINGRQKAPKEGDACKVVMIQNGTATVRFYPDEFYDSENVLLASFPGTGNNIYSMPYRPYRLFNVDDKFIPGNVTDTKLTISNMVTYPSSNAIFKATLTDIDGTPVAYQSIVFKINGKTLTAQTDANGVAQIKIFIAKEGTYAITANFVGDDIDYTSSEAKASVVVKKSYSKIYASNMYMIPKMYDYYSITLKDASGKAIAYQTVTFKVNGKTYSVKTDKNGVAKIRLKLNKGVYSVHIKFAGTNKYKAVSKTNYLYVKYSSKTAKLATPTVTILPNTYKTYTISLKNADGKGIANQKVTIKLNGKTYTKTTNSNGLVSLKVKFAKLGSYKVYASYSGSKIYRATSATGKIVVAKAATKFVAPTLSVLPNEKKTYTVALKTTAGKTLSSQKITIAVNGKTYSRITNARGQASIDVVFPTEKTYAVVLNYLGNTYYKPIKTTSSVAVSKMDSQLLSYNKTFAADSSKIYTVTLKDKNGKPLANKEISFVFNGKTVVNTTNQNGVAQIKLNDSGSFNITSKFAGDNQYRPVSADSLIAMSDKTNVVFVDANLPNSEIQNILDNCAEGSKVEFLGKNYDNIALTVDKSLNIYSENNSTLNAKANCAVFTIMANNVTISDFTIVSNMNDAIVIDNGYNVVISGNNISNKLDESKLDSYMKSTISLPGYGIAIANSENIKINNNSIYLFESGIYAYDSNKLTIADNLLEKNNYGIKYDYGVANSNITNNKIYDSIGLYTNLVPEGPRGYGIFLNNSAVNVTITKNNITWNHLGISVDANHTTGIVIKSNLISDNVLEGIRFNEGYDLAKNAVEPVVVENAIYRNARGPSMMILGELSANPAGIYGPGAFNASLRLNIGTNWYGKNQIVTWDNDTGVVGYGTMCPRINTTGIAFKEITCVTPGTYSITFYDKDVVASNLPVFDMFATLNDDVEVKFDVVNGVGVFSFDAGDFKEGENVIKVSIGSLTDSDRLFKVEMSKTLSAGEIPD